MERYTPTVMVQGWQTVETGDQEHMDFDDPDCEHWCVWLRRDFPDRVPEPGKVFEPFDSADEYERDFDDVSEAEEYARYLAGCFDCEVDFY